MSELRRAALVLHGLAANDRDWLLTQLPDASADDLRALLAELEALGMPADPALIRAAVKREDAPAEPAKPAFGEIAAASAGQMLELLRDEPDRLIAIVISSSNWPWREALLSQLQAERARDVREQALSLNVGARLRGVVLEALSQRIHLSNRHPSMSRTTARAPTGRFAALHALRGRVQERLQAWRR
ncbi:MAG TPA: hypothetical protein VNU71_07595 [Burkholderiaceae bacterium]|nr:hypothetical protein [Burkholderiaceae bacterium]